MGELADLACQLGVNLRVNIYKSVLTRQHQPSYEQFWQAIADMAETAYFIACSEPVVNAAIGNARIRGYPCGKSSFRVHPDGRIVPCVYLRDGDVTLSDFLNDVPAARDLLEGKLRLELPEICARCEYVTICGGGCASRRLLDGSNQPDEYCFVMRGERPAIRARWKESKDLVHENYLCTMIFSG
jgi:radical SAM protein with 4Fe4S-binding SPASM domain